MSENFRKTTEEDVAKEIAVLKNAFSDVRLLAEGEVGAAVKDCPDKRIIGDCYKVWKRRKPCRNCISYRALTEKKRFSKIVKTNDGVFHVTADYREVDGKPCVIEMINKFGSDIAVDFGNEDRNPEKLDEYFDKTYTDVLTGTYNRRYYEEYLSNENLDGGVAMIDLDDFKIYNDLFGHDVGDAVLKAVAKVIKRSVRSGDAVVRYGGDEFLLVVSGVNDESFARCLRDVGAAVRNVTFAEYPAIKPSVSIGFVVANGETVKNAASRADEYMYLAKKKKDFIVTEARIEKQEAALPKKERVLVVDDSPLNREILSSILKNEYDVLEAENGKRAIEKINECGADVAAVLLDLVMPEMNGFEFLDYAIMRGIISDIPVIAITGDESSGSMRAAYEKGVADYITRPFDAKVVYRRVSNAVKLYSRQKLLINRLTGEMRDKEKNRNMIVEIFSRIVESSDVDNGTHAGHMMKFTELILKSYIRKNPDCGLTNSDVYVISTAAALHDIGKSRIPHSILNKKSRFTPEEYEIMKTHTVEGEKILKNIKTYENEPLVKYACEICRHHHERYDGKGYPDGLKGDEIPISAQAVAICDVYDALITERSYKPAYPHEKAVEMIKSGECGVFNPLMIECLDECTEEFQSITREGR